MSPVRRSLASLLFGLAAIVGSLALSGFWLQYTALSPGRTRDNAAAVLGDNDIKNEVATAIATATVAQLPQFTAVDIHSIVVQTESTNEGARLMADIVADAHARLIGADSKPVTITSDELVEILRDQRAAVVPPVVLPVPRVGALSTMREVLVWLLPIGGGLAVLLIVLALAAHPEKPELLRSLAELFFALALLLVIVGYVVPAFVVPLFSSDPWVNAVPRLAQDSLPPLLGITVLFCALGLACYAAGAASKRRDRWSQPIRRTSYREERRWG
ncbi:MAG: hypothetical protein JWM34_4906 [Ilumatobacteraceae bacterium]|nr:hypothetical protein [Ilumatobacteraceae bacterium]